VKAFLLALVVGVLLGDASGALALVSQESCTSWTDEMPDGKCPPLCARCACGVPSVVPAAPASAAAPLTLSEPTLAFVSAALDAPPHEILHVPR
jgi:hypothetical protein